MQHFYNAGIMYSCSFYAETSFCALYMQFRCRIVQFDVYRSVQNAECKLQVQFVQTIQSSAA